MIKNLTFFYGLMLLSIYSNAATYYFSVISGEDNRTSIKARNPSTPWKSLDKMNEVFKSLQPGDSILFKRGETFYGSMLISKSGTSEKPIVIGSYGNGPKPIISSLVSLVDWVDLGNGIYESTHPNLGDNLNIFLLDNILMERGRFPNRNAPNGGYMNIESVNHPQSISSSELPTSTNWTGAEVVIRKSYFTIDRHPIIAHSKSTIDFAPVSGTYNVHKNFGFFIQDHPATLDQVGEWHYQPSSKKIRVYFGSQAPDSFGVQVGTIDDLVNNTAQTSNVILENLCLQGANQNSIFIEQGKGFSIRGIDIEFSGDTGIKARNLSDLEIKDCSISYSNNNGINLLQNTPGASIINNNVEFTGTMTGMGQSGVGNGYGIHAPSDNARVEYNRIIHTGYIGIRFGGNNSSVMYNYVDNFCLNKNDGAGIYTWTGGSNENFQGRKIISNIVLNGKGSKDGTPLPQISNPAVEGIYIDDNASGIEISNNTIANVSSKGLYIHNARDLVIKNNTIYNNQFQLYISQDAPDSPIKNNIATENILFSKLATQKAISIHSNQDDITDMIHLDKNFYVGRTGQLPIKNQRTNEASLRISAAYDLDSWKEDSGNEQQSQNIELDIPLYRINKLLESNRYPRGMFDENIDGLHCFSPSKNCELSWDQNSNMDGGSLKISSKALAFILVGSGSVESKKNYILKFSAKADKNASLDLFLRQSGSSYHTLSEIHSVKLEVERNEYEIHFSSPVKEENSSIVFESGAENLTYWLDNIEFYEAEVETPDPEKYILFEYNSTQEDKTVSLDGCFLDVKKKKYVESLILKPFTSVVLMRCKI